MYICFNRITGTGCGAMLAAVAQRCPHCGAAHNELWQSVAPGTTVADYTVEQLINVSRTGFVYRAFESSHTPRAVVLKAVAHPLAAHRLKMRFPALQSTRHISLPRYEAYMIHDGVAYLAMELVEGPSLADLLSAGSPLQQEKVVRGYAIQLCDALHYLHHLSPPLVHEDIKPANIRISPAGVARLVDLGCAPLTTGQLDLTLARSPYTPLELVVGKAVDQRTDIYALAATLYQVLTGTAPYPVVERLKERAAVGPVMLHDRLSPAISAAIEQGLAILPAKRWQTIAEFRSELTGHPWRDTALTPRPLPPRPEPPTAPGAPAPTATLPRRSTARARPQHYRSVTVLIALFILLVGGGWWLLSARGRSSAGNEPPVTGPLLLAEDFSTEEAANAFFTIAPGTPQGKGGVVQDGQYHFLVPNSCGESSCRSIFVLPGDIPADVSLALTVDFTHEPAADLLVIVLGMESGGTPAYRITLTSEQRFGLGIVGGPSIVPMRRQAELTGAQDRIRVDHRDGVITVYANGHMLITHRGEAHGGGSIALFAEAELRTTPSVLGLDALTIRAFGTQN